MKQTQFKSLHLGLYNKIVYQNKTDLLSCCTLELKWDLKCVFCARLDLAYYLLEQSQLTVSGKKYIST